MRATVSGIPVYVVRRTLGVQLSWSRTPKGETRYIWRVGNWDHVVVWGKYVGYFLASSSTVPGRTPLVKYQWPNVEVQKMKRVHAPDTGERVIPSLSKDCPSLKKYPRFLEFMTDRVYDDGEARQPGQTWLGSDAAAFTVMLKEPSACLCVRLRAADLESLFQAIELFLKMDAPPWEVDEWAMAKRPKMKKKKGS